MLAAVAEEGASAPSSENLVRLVFPGVTGAVLLPDDCGLCAGLRTALRGWEPRIERVPVRDATEAGEVLCAATPMSGADSGRYHFHSNHLDAPMSGLGPAAVVCGVIAELVQNFCDGPDIALGLHCGAVRIGERLVLIAGPRRAGKSTLVARMACEPDLEYFTDDVLPVRADGQAIALGAAPRLRLPLPDGASPGFRSTVERNLGLRDRQYGYLSSPSIAPHGREAPLGALVILDRQIDGTPARLHATEQSDAVYTVLRQSITGLSDPESAFLAARRLTGDVPAYRLVYSDLEDALALVRLAFASGGDPSQRVSVGPILPPLSDQPPDRSGLPAGAKWERASDAAVRRVGSAAFLWRPNEARLWHLNTVAHAVWAMLEQPATIPELVAALSEVFTETPSDEIASDVRRLVSTMLDWHFVKAAGT